MEGVYILVCRRKRGIDASEVRPYLGSLSSQSEFEVLMRLKSATSEKDPHTWSLIGGEFNEEESVAYQKAHGIHKRKPELNLVKKIAIRAGKYSVLLIALVDLSHFIFCIIFTFCA